MITIDGVSFNSIREFVDFCSKLKEVDIDAYDKFLSVDEVKQPLTQQTIETMRTQYIRYHNYTPIFWFQTKQQKAIPVYNKGFRPDINSRFVREFSVPYRGTNQYTPVRLYYNFVKQQRYAVIV